MQSFDNILILKDILAIHAADAGLPARKSLPPCGNFCLAVYGALTM
jgi:hypothetical protein